MNLCVLKKGLLREALFPHYRTTTLVPLNRLVLAHPCLVSVQFPWHSGFLFHIKAAAAVILMEMHMGSMFRADFAVYGENLFCAPTSCAYVKDELTNDGELKGVFLCLSSLVCRTCTAYFFLTLLQSKYQRGIKNQKR